MNRPFLSALALIAASALSFSNSAQAQTQGSASSEAIDDDTYDYAADLVTSMSLINENCKGALEPTYYEGFKVMLRVNYGVLGATDEDLKTEEARIVELADFICADKAACWRSPTELPATATIEEGRAKCTEILINGMKEFDDLLDGNSKPAT